MSEPSAGSLADEWRAIAKRDWHRLELLRSSGDSVAAGFYLQQAIEKFLKAYLVQRGWPLRKTHELDRLLDAAHGFDVRLAAFRPLCERVSGYYLVERYPGAGEGPDAGQVAADVQEAEQLVRALG